MSRTADPTPKRQLHVLVPKTLYETVQKVTQDEGTNLTEVVIAGLELFLANHKRRTKNGKESDRGPAREPVRQGR